MGTNSVRLRFYAAGALHATAIFWIVCWGVSRFNSRLLSLFGPTGWLPIPLSLMLVFAGVHLMVRSRPVSHAGERSWVVEVRPPR
jgi:hypothetical protein